MKRIGWASGSNACPHLQDRNCPVKVSGYAVRPLPCQLPFRKSTAPLNLTHGDNQADKAIIQTTTGGVEATLERHGIEARVEIRAHRSIALHSTLPIQNRLKPHAGPSSLIPYSFSGTLQGIKKADDFLCSYLGGPLQVARQGIKRVFRHLTAHSPFQGLGGVIAFEVDWKNVVGIDYSNPLCLAGRLVLESHHVVKRDFPSVGEPITYPTQPPFVDCASDSTEI